MFLAIERQMILTENLEKLSMVLFYKKNEVSYLGSQIPKTTKHHNSVQTLTHKTTF